MFRRLLVVLGSVLVVAGVALLPQLAAPAVGATSLTRPGSVVPTALAAGATTRFCGAGFAPGAALDVRVGAASAQSTTADGDGTFCVALRAAAAADGPSQLLAVGQARDGGLLSVTGGVAIAPAADRAEAAPLAAGGTTDALVLGLWAGVAGLGLLGGLVGIVLQRRRATDLAVVTVPACPSAPTFAPRPAMVGAE